MTTRLLGIDPGSRRTGLGVIDVDAYGHYTFVHCGVLNLLIDTDNFPERLGRLAEGIDAAIDQWQPQQVAIETVFMDKSATSALKLGHARGAAIATVVRRGLPLAEYAPRVIKQSLVGKGAADKDQVQHMVKILLNLQGERLFADAADALAVEVGEGEFQQGPALRPGRVVAEAGRHQQGLAVGRVGLDLAAEHDEGPRLVPGRQGAAQRGAGLLHPRPPGRAGGEAFAVGQHDLHEQYEAGGDQQRADAPPSRPRERGDFRRWTDEAGQRARHGGGV